MKPAHVFLPSPRRPVSFTLSDAAEGGGIEGLPFDPSTPPEASLRIVVSELRESNHDFAQGKCAHQVHSNLQCEGRI